jgi:hypothetical protein
MGIGSTASSSYPTISFGSYSVDIVTVGNSHVCVSTGNVGIYCSEYNSNYQLVNGYPDDSVDPVPVLKIDLLTFQKVWQNIGFRKYGSSSIWLDELV